VQIDILSVCRSNSSLTFYQRIRSIWHTDCRWNSHAGSHTETDYLLAVVKSEVSADDVVRVEQWTCFVCSHNAGVNYANRNATQETPLSKFAIGYCAAVTVSVSIAVRQFSRCEEKLAHRSTVLSGRTDHGHTSGEGVTTEDEKYCATIRAITGRR
jgi:hypothetical protein